MSYYTVDVDIDDVLDEADNDDLLDELGDRLERKVITKEKIVEELDLEADEPRGTLKDDLKQEELDRIAYCLDWWQLRKLAEMIERKELKI